MIVENERVATEHLGVDSPPIEPHGSLAPFAPTATRALAVFGAPVEAVLVPGRKARGDRADAGRPPFRRSPAPRILAAESYWRDDVHALTPNRYPFARQQRMLWPLQPRREPDEPMWAAALAWSEAGGGTVLVNTVGAAATIAWAHAHLTPERLGFLAGLREGPGPADLVDLPAGVELVQKDVPCCLLGVRGGDVRARAAAIVALTVARLTPAWNVCVERGTAWLLPRTVETPAPWFPFALGAAELWGRWCYVDEEPFAAATGDALERALVTAGAPARTS